MQNTFSWGKGDLVRGALSVNADGSVDVAITTNRFYDGTLSADVAQQLARSILEKGDVGGVVAPVITWTTISGTEEECVLDDGACTLATWAHGARYHWEVSFPDGLASGDATTREEARAIAVKVYGAIR